jgi:hypothetical protein
MNALSYVRMVLWSFFGVRRGAAAGRELTQARPVLLAVTAVGLAAVFVAGLLAMANFAVRGLG